MHKIKLFKKIHKEEELGESDDNYNLSEALSDSNQQHAEKEILPPKATYYHFASQRAYK
jgi:hypothetical protein